MSRTAVKEFIRSRPSIFWWTILNVLAACFAVASWSVCLYVFNFPERPANYDLLRKVKRLSPVDSHTPLDAPDGLSAEPQDLLRKFYALSGDQLTAHNRYFKRNYITNFESPEVVSYVEGTYRVTHCRPLAEDDFFHPGLAVRAQATVMTDELREPSPYPVVLEILLPLGEDPAGTTFPEGFVFSFKKLDHRLMILHATLLGSANEPLLCLTTVPLAFQNYRGPNEASLPLAPPDPLNMRASFPAMEENRAP